MIQYRILQAYLLSCQVLKKVTLLVRHQIELKDSRTTCEADDGFYNCLRPEFRKRCVIGYTSGKGVKEKVRKNDGKK